ncbi:CHRD domain-containing protein [Dyadobacter sp. CY323]|uniref:CHRD domain-containing protein n=1 Tax=Dyadobacter sp. CY323 TaxID=2907302 RepID=UPI001F3558DC|nr:CHRD domain-containing protein [Dyadobacter sp. CY323]MCE6991492.1 CHRD domain-containing protein [Dyadobacter sp. CY323]
MKKISLLFLLSLPLIASRCADHALQPVQKVEATLLGINEVPAVTTQASGKFTGTFDPNTKMLKFNLSYTGLSPVAGHIHSGAAGTNGPVVIPFLSVATSPIAYEVILTDAQVTGLQTNNLYTNLHTPMYPGGEIRAGHCAIRNWLTADRERQISYPIID